MPHPRPEERRRRVWRDAGSNSCFAAPFFGPRVADATNGAKSPRMVISLPPATHFTSLILRRLLRSKRPRKDTPEDAVCLFASASLWPSRRQSHKPLEIGSHGDFLTAGAAFHRPHPEAPLAKQEASKDAPEGAVCLFASASLWPSRRQFHKPLEIGSHIGLLLGARPAFDSPLSRDSLGGSERQLLRLGADFRHGGCAAGLGRGVGVRRPSKGGCVTSSETARSSATSAAESRPVRRRPPCRSRSIRRARR